MKGIPYYPRRCIYREFWRLVPETRCNLLETLNEKSKSEMNAFCSANRSLLNAERRIERLGFPWQRDNVRRSKDCTKKKLAQSAEKNTLNTAVADYL